MALRFNIEAFKIEFFNIFVNELDFVFNSWKEEVLNRVSSGFMRKGAAADVVREVHLNANCVVAYLKVNTYVLADSYGTGSLMLTDNPGYQEYRNSKYWNPDRKSTTIVGRRAGSYIDLFNRPRKSSGRMKGVSIENLHVKFRGNGPESRYDPRPPSKALHDANKILHQSLLPKAYERTVKRINFAKFLIES